MDFSFLADTPLFKNVSQKDAEKILGCLGAFCKKYQKGNVIYGEGQKTHNIGLVLSGSVNIERGDVWGNTDILGHFGKGQIFAETYAFLPDVPLSVNVTAADDTEVMFIDASKLMTSCRETCECHSAVIKNLLALTAEKNLHLSDKIFYTSHKTIRGRLMAYLSRQASVNGDMSFTIPFDRQQLADYLGVDRSALSAELSKMRKDGILTYRKNFFSIKETK